MSSCEQTKALCERNIERMFPDEGDSNPLDLSAESLLRVANLRFFLRSQAPTVFALPNAARASVLVIPASCQNLQPSICWRFASKPNFKSNRASGRFAPRSHRETLIAEVLKTLPN